MHKYTKLNNPQSCKTQTLIFLHCKTLEPKQNFDTSKVFFALLDGTLRPSKLCKIFTPELRFIKKKTSNITREPEKS